MSCYWEFATDDNRINHITISVQDLEASLKFYTEILNFTADVRWRKGAYLHLGELWLCLSVGKVAPSQDYTHIAFSVEKADFEKFLNKIKSYKISEWQENVSEGDSLYFLDPDGHKLEVHAGDLQSRLDSLRIKPYSDLQWLS